MFIDLLGRLSVSQVRMLDHACKNAHCQLTPAGWLSALGPVAVDLATLKSLTGLEDIQRLDRELDHLRALGLLDERSGGFNVLSTVADLTPSPLGVQMYARCNGYGDPVEFYRKKGTLVTEGAA